MEPEMAFRSIQDRVPSRDVFEGQRKETRRLVVPRFDITQRFDQSQKTRTDQRITQITDEITRVPPPPIPAITPLGGWFPSGGGGGEGGRRRGVYSFREVIPAKGLLFRELPQQKQRGRYSADDRLYRKETDQLTGKTRKKYYGKLVDTRTIVTKRKTIFKRKR